MVTNCTISTDYRESVGNKRRAPIEVTILDPQDHSPIAELAIAPYGAIYETGYDTSPFHIHDLVGSRSFANNGRDKNQHITGSQLFMSTRDKRWDVWLSKQSTTEEIPRLVKMANEIEAWLAPGTDETR